MIDLHEEKAALAPAADVKALQVDRVVPVDAKVARKGDRAGQVVPEAGKAGPPVEDLPAVGWGEQRR